jgi:hypothetical protein
VPDVLGHNPSYLCAGSDFGCLGSEYAEKSLPCPAVPFKHDARREDAALRSFSACLTGYPNTRNDKVWTPQPRWQRAGHGTSKNSRHNRVIGSNKFGEPGNSLTGTMRELTRLRGDGRGEVNWEDVKSLERYEMVFRMKYKDGLTTARSLITQHGHVSGHSSSSHC